MAALVASVDADYAQFPVTLRIQPSRVEMMVERTLSEMFTSRLELYRSCNGGNLPVNIVIFRDGVAEGQYDQVVHIELRAIRAACEKFYTAHKKPKPLISIIACGKRHSTRFYPTSTTHSTMDMQNGNPKPGTVVDRAITDPRDWDFYLQAHKAIKGTARPCHYVVIHDEIFIKEGATPEAKTKAATALQQFANDISYMWGRATRSVSYAPPAYYADKACTRARAYLSTYFNEGDSDDASQSSKQSEIPKDETQAQKEERQRKVAAELEALRKEQEKAIRLHNRLKDTMFYI